MKEILSNYGEDTRELRYEKYKGRVYIYILFLFIGFLLLAFSLVDITSGTYKENTDVYGVFIFSLFSLIISIGNLLSYFANKITISESFIIIRRAVLGKTYVIPKKNIIAKTIIFTSARGMYQYQILLYLKSGKTINTGLLNCREDEFHRIDDEFKFKKVTRRKDLRWEKINFDADRIKKEDFKVKFNYFISVVSFVILASLIYYHIFSCIS